MKRVAVATVGAVAGIVALVAGCGGAGAGPFAWPKDAGTSEVSLPVRPGETAATTINMSPTLTVPAVLLDVHPIHPEDARGLTLRYAATTGRRGLEILIWPGWHPSAWQLHPLTGFVIPAHAPGGVTIGASSRRRGVHLIRGFVVDYRIGSTRYSASMQQELKLCVGMRECP